MSGALDGLIAILDLETLEENLFRGRSPDVTQQRVFGGQVAGQALVAAGRTLDSVARPAHSLHAYFLRPGDTSVPIIYEVHRLRDGQSFTTRRVDAIQHGRPIFHMQASFQVVEEGVEHFRPMPEVPRPEDLPTTEERLGDKAQLLKSWIRTERPIELRYVTMPSGMTGEIGPPSQQVWFRTNGTPPSDQMLQRCLVTYVSDMTLLDISMGPHAHSWFEPRFQVASLDHAMWFHNDIDASQWMLYDQYSPFAGGARGLSQGYIYSADGRLVTTVTQEGLIRPLRK
ncbi:MAG: acyl-CoA thioesterase II [Acidimicrobiia bacterium]|jgi:acyl-CoA thioesterase-2|nr:acyl-CoA thioesterase II [Acidimicrobiia bacterium]MBP8179594.1 acyl-CoA thioesterase II [Acidimicrobiia bacterium]